MQLSKVLVFYVVAWLCFANLFFFASAAGSVRKNPQYQSATSGSSSTVVVSGNPCVPPVGKFRTYTQTEYGTPGTKANNFLTQFFPTLFPNGITLGANVVLGPGCLLTNLVAGVLNLVGGLLDTVLTVVFTTVDSLVCFLPQLEQPQSLVSSLVNPITNAGGLLCGDLVALALNLGLDANVPSFCGTQLANLSSLVFIRGPCAGLSLEVVVNLANGVLGGIISPLLGTCPLAIPANIDVCLAAANANFLDAVSSGSYLALPGFNLQACLNLKLPIIDVHANVQLQLLSPLSRSVGVYLDADILGLVDLDVDVAIGNNQRLHCWLLDAHHTIPVGTPQSLTGFLVPVPSTLGSLLANLVGDVLYLVDDVLCLVNYLLNFCPLAATAKDLQAVIFMLTNPAVATVAELLQLVPDLLGCNVPLVNAILADVRLNGVGFVPAPGQVVGVVANVNVAGVATRVLLELDVPLLDLSVSSNLCIAL